MNRQDRGGRGESQRGQVRIIAGQWRGRRLPVADVPGLRPTGDRLRETLFSWLMPWLPGARCLDLYAGSGALGLEAASRGAAAVTLVDSDPRAVAVLRANVATLAAEAVEVVQADAPAWLARSDGCYDMVFVDPPFTLVELEELLVLLVDHTRPGGWIYLEQPLERQHPLPPALWVHRDKRVGAVRALLLRRSRESD